MTGDSGYTLLEMVVVLAVTSIILIVFSNSLLNNYRLVKKYSTGNRALVKMRILQTVQKDLENSFSAELNGDGLEMTIPVPDEENRYLVNRVRYVAEENRLVRTETGSRDRTRKTDLAGYQFSFQWDVVTNATNLNVIFTDTNGNEENYNAGIYRGKE